MNTNISSIRERAAARETLESRQQALLDHSARARRAMIAAWTAASTVVIFGLGIVLASCGQEHADQQASVTPPVAQENTVASLNGSAVQGPVAQPASGAPEALRPVAPDVSASASDTFVGAGQAIEVHAEGTPDVVEMALSDGRGDALPMVRDSTGNVWRVNYRVPLHPKSDRIGLAVTAKNETHQWRRVWVFLVINDGKQEVETETPDTLQSEQK